MGIPAFYTPTGFGTYVEIGGFAVKFKPGGKEPQEFSKAKEKKIFDGQSYLLEEAIKGDFALIKAQKADTFGNLFMRKTAKNFNVDMAGAATITVAEVEEIVQPGELDSDHIHVPGIFVDRIYKGPSFERKNEKIVYTTDEGIKIKGAVKMKSDADQKIREKIAKRASQELENGMYVNLGIGIPMLVPAFLPHGVQIELHSENGVLGIGPYPRPGEEDSDLINAGKVI
jgi:3-oxoacid CoA-transferase